MSFLQLEQFTRPHVADRSVGRFDSPISFPVWSTTLKLGGVVPEGVIDLAGGHPAPLGAGLGCWIHGHYLGLRSLGSDLVEKDLDGLRMMLERRLAPVLIA